ncbi:hypothetical protein PCC9214_05078 [Planktothrix tepida]|nr:hypothetical protein [Planktothrix tepida]CAD5982906.1 hypothetical protein PCC9214_05078 [Planktothrix tepida]
MKINFLIPTLISCWYLKDTDSSRMKVTRIQRVEPLPLSTYQQDANLPAW